MRILIASDQHWPMLSGVATAGRELAQGLARAGHEVLVVAPSQTGGKYEEKDGNYSLVRTRSVPIPFRENLRLSVALQNEIKKIIEAFNPDIVHVQTQLNVGLTALRMARKLDIPVVATNHVMPENLIENIKLLLPIARPVNHLLKEYGILLYKGAEHIIMPTQAAIDLVNIESIKVPVTAVSNGIDLSEFRPGRVTRIVKGRFGIPADTPIVTFVGRLDAEKHIDVLLRAAQRILQEVPIHVLIIGDGKQREELKDFAQELGIAQHVTFTGRVSDDDLRRLHRCATVFAMPSPAELQSLATLEAMASGQPVVAVNAGALYELCHDGKNGYLFRLDDDEDMADKLLTILRDPKLRQKMSEASLQIARTHDIENVIKRFEAIYRDVIRKHNAAASLV